MWLPGGGYHRDAWKVLAGTGMALATGSKTPIPARWSPLAARFRSISRELDPDRSASSGLLTAADLEEALGLGGEHRNLLLHYYTASGLEHSLYRYGLLGFLERIGYGPFRVRVDRADPGGDRVRLLGEAHGGEHLLIELILQRRRVAGSDVLFVHWLSMRNPLARFSGARPRLPGQEVPGLGLAREMGELLALMARRLALAGVRSSRRTSTPPSRRVTTSPSWTRRVRGGSRRSCATSRAYRSSRRPSRSTTGAPA